MARRDRGSSPSPKSLPRFPTGAGRTACGGSASARERPHSSMSTSLPMRCTRTSRVWIWPAVVRQDPDLAGTLLGGRAYLRRWPMGTLRVERLVGRARFVARRPDQHCPSLGPGLERPDRRSSLLLGALKPITLWVPSQNGRMRDWPQRHNATVPRSTRMSAPSWSRKLTGPRTSSGPSR